MFVFGTFLLARDSQPNIKPTPTIVINNDDSDKTFARKRGKGGRRDRRRGGSGLR